MSIECQRKDCKWNNKSHWGRWCSYTKETGHNVELDKQGKCQKYEQKDN